jgi:hypothetical protein
MTLQEIIDEVYAKHDAECLRLTKERDEARREVCESEKYCLEEAKKRGWDCFDKKETQ